MPKRHRDEKRIGSAVSKRRCSAKIGVQSIDDSSFRHVDGMLATPETYQVAPLSSTLSEHGYSSSTATMSPILAWPRQYGTDDNNTMKRCHIKNASQNDKVACASAVLNPEKAGYARFCSDVYFGAADAASCYHGHLSSNLRDVSASCLSSLGNEQSPSPPYDAMQSAPNTNIQWQEKSLTGGMMYCSPFQGLIPAEIPVLNMQHMGFNTLLEDEARSKQSKWPITQANYYNNIARPTENVEREKSVSCILENLTQMQSRLQNQTRRQLAEIKCSLVSSS